MLETSAAILSSNERRISVPANHRNIGKIAQHGDQKWQIVGYEIVKLARDIANFSHSKYLGWPCLSAEGH